MRVTRISSHHAGRSRPRRRPSAASDWRGFQVVGAGGRVGILHEVRASENAPVLAVGAGAAGRRVLLFPASEVHRVDTRGRRLDLRAGAAPVGTEPYLPADAA
jgi:hypothetical protein